MSPRTLEPGASLGGFQIESALAQGICGNTYLAREISSDRQVAIKEYYPIACAMRGADAGLRVLPDRQREFDLGRQRFLEDGHMLLPVCHPNIVRVLDVFEENQTAYVAMVYEPGERLSDAIKRGLIFSDQSLLPLSLALVDAMRTLHHSGVIHRDIKETNIHLRSDGSPVILDFGAARVGLLRRRMELGHAADTEDDQDLNGNAGPWTDIHALAALLHRLAATPRRSQSSAFVPVQGCSAELIEAIRIGLAAKPGNTEQVTAEWSGALDILSRRSNADAEVASAQVERVVIHAHTQKAVANASTEIVERLVADAVTEPRASRHHSKRRKKKTRQRDRAEQLLRARNRYHADAQPELKGPDAGASQPNAVSSTAHLASAFAVTAETHALPADLHVPALRSPQDISTRHHAPVAPARVVGTEESHGHGRSAGTQTSANGDIVVGERRVHGALLAGRRLPVHYLAIVAVMVGIAIMAMDWFFAGGVEKTKEDQPVPAKAIPAPPRSSEVAGFAAKLNPPTPLAFSAARRLPAPDPGDKEITGLLTAAAVDVAALRLTSPSGLNALEKYQAVLLLQPGNADAVDGITQIAHRYVVLAEAAISQGRYAKADRYLKLAQKIDPDNEGVRQTQSKLSRLKQANRETVSNDDSSAQRPEVVSTDNTERVAVERGDGLLGRVREFFRPDPVATPTSPTRADEIPGRLGGAPE